MDVLLGTTLVNYAGMPSTSLRVECSFLLVSRQPRYKAHTVTSCPVHTFCSMLFCLFYASTHFPPNDSLSSCLLARHCSMATRRQELRSSLAPSCASCLLVTPSRWDGWVTTTAATARSCVKTSHKTRSSMLAPSATDP